MKKRVAALMMVALSATGCQGDNPAGTGEPEHERAGEIRTANNYSAIRMAVSDNADSVLAGPGGSEAWFVSKITAGQVVIVRPDAAPLGQTIRFRVFTSKESSAQDVRVTLIEGAMENGEVEAATGSIVWDK